MLKINRDGLWAMLAAVGVAWWLEKLIRLEWSYPYCNDRSDGPAGAIRGFPFPYEQASIVTSATDFFIPWLYLINLAIITAVVILLLRPLRSRLEALTPRICKLLVGAVGVLLLVTVVALDVLGIYMGVWRPTSSFSGMPPYSELRPVEFRMFGRQPECPPSSFWFPEK